MAVRGSGAGLNAELRERLGELAERLQSRGFRAEAYAPDEAGVAREIPATRPPAAAGEPARDASADPEGRRQDGRQQRQDRERPPDWLFDLEARPEEEAAADGLAAAEAARAVTRRPEAELRRINGAVWPERQAGRREKEGRRWQAQ